MEEFCDLFKDLRLYFKLIFKVKIVKIVCGIIDVVVKIFGILVL